MQPCTLRFWSFGGSIFLSLLASQAIVAEIVPDSTIPVHSAVVGQGNTIVIEGGTSSGENLFHSFQEFSLSSGDTAFFNNDLPVRNIITRITGGVRSNIDGTIRANGSANLFFINPNGIVFGSNASLQIGGSFVASTATSLRFADDTEYSATDSQTSALLTVSVPIGLQFGSNPGEIINQSQASPNGAVNTFGLPVGLQVQSGRTLALVGGNVLLDCGNLTAVGGKIELGSVSEKSLVSLKEIATGYALEYISVENFQDIQIQGAMIDASGESGGTIQLQGRDIILTNNSQVFSTTLGAGIGAILAINATNLTAEGGASIFTSTRSEGQAGDVIVKASNSVELAKTTPDGLSVSGIGSLVESGATGNGGNITLETGQLSIRDGAVVSTSTLGAGGAGDVIVRASDSANLIGVGLYSPSAIVSQVFSDATGSGGNVTLETRQLSIRDGAAIDVSTFGVGRAGNVLVRTSDSIELMGIATIFNPVDQITPIKSTSGIFAQVADGAIDDAGNAGDLTIETRQLIVSGGAQISTAARTGGNGGTLSINASDAIQLIGTSSFATADPLDENRSGIFVSAEPGAIGDVGNLNITTELLTVEDGARISADNLGSSSTGGNATLNVRQLLIRDGGEVRAGSFSEGSGGTLSVNAAESVEIIGSGMIGSEPVKSILFTQAEAAGDAGNLTITTRNLMVRDGAEVTVSGRSSGDAGNLIVEANSISLDNQATLSADTKAGQGNINLNSVAFVLRRGSSITTNAEGSDITGGNININADVLAALENSDISANSADFRGGNVIITAQGIFGTQFREQLTPESDITATGANSFLNGQVTINTPDVDPSQGLTELPVEPVNVEVAQGCQVGGSQSSVAFFNTGRGGLAPNPYEPISSSNIWEDVPLPTQEIANSASTARVSTSPNTIIEAKGWIVNQKGEVILVSEMPTNLSQNRCNLR